jgi:hypothetical protein
MGLQDRGLQQLSLQWSFMEIDRALLPAVTLAVINQARTNVVVYCGGNDAYTFTGDLEGLVTSIFLKPFSVK